MTLYLTAAPDRLAQARAATAQLAHAAYRIGLGSQLLAAPLPAALRGGLMVVSDRQAPTVEQPEPLARQLVRVCLRRGFSGVVLDLEELRDVLSAIRFLGCRGTTGTEASFLSLFEGDSAKIDEMNRKLAASFGFDRLYDVCGQTYPRKLDSRILNVLSSIAQSCCRFANDIRLLQHDRQVEEPFEESQVGSSAMPYKRNPMRCERICSLSRYIMADAMNAPMTASTQWLERTLDDSANRRISLPEAFLACDGILRLMQNVTKGLHVNEKIVARFVSEYLPFIATENLLMAAVKHGGDRQQVHEIIRKASMEATAQMKNGERWDLIAALAAEPAFGMTEAEIKSHMDPANYIGRCPEQVHAFTKKCRALCSSAAVCAEEISL